MLADADVLLDNYRPGVIDRLGFTAETIRTDYPRLIWCSITGFGADGPYADRPAYDAVAGALSGIAQHHARRETPKASGPTIADNVTGMYAAYGILGALYEREANRSRPPRRSQHVRGGRLLHSGCIPELHPAADSTTVRARGWRLAVLRLPLRRRQATGAASVVAAKILGSVCSRVIERPDLADDPRFADRDGRVRNYLILEDESGARSLRVRSACTG